MPDSSHDDKGKATARNATAVPRRLNNGLKGHESRAQVFRPGHLVGYDSGLKGRKKSSIPLSMPQSLSQVYAHLVFSTKDREPWLTDDIQARLFPYLAGALNNQDSAAVKVGGHFDHVHLLYRISRNQIPSKVIGEIKAQSSKWAKEEFPRISGFAW